MSIEIPVYPEDVSAAFLSELVGELRPGVTVEAVDVVAVKGYGDADTSHSVSTSTQVSFEVRYSGAGHEELPTRLLAKMPIPDEVECANPELGPLVTTRLPSGCRGDACVARTSGEPNRQMQTLRGSRHTGEACLAPTHPSVSAPIPDPGRSRGGE